ncbi:MAG: hypothetical protein N3B01_12100, partial [Verrucomicrobiae bacterium]|nr:hypothetical protein [Verrucomicrobiae bacterium]
MSTSTQLPDYITSATPNPASNRAPWYKNTAPTSVPVMLELFFKLCFLHCFLLAFGLGSDRTSPSAQYTPL